MITIKNKRKIYWLSVAVGVLFIDSCVNSIKIDRLQERVANLEHKLPEIKYAPLESFFAIEPDLAKSIIQVESSGNPEAYNPNSKAVGLMQLRPVIYNKLCGLTKKEAFDPQNNVACGTLFIKHLLRKYGGNLEKALLFYNNGYIVTNEEYAEKVLAFLEKEFDKSESDVIR